MFDTHGFRGSVTIPGSKIYLVAATWIASPVGKQNNSLVLYEAWHQKRGNLFSVWMKNLAEEKTL